jgi:uncharacterized membrane protein YbhN (UPF0104 family)
MYEAKALAARATTRLLAAFSRLSARTKNLLAYAVALAIVVFVARGISFEELGQALGRANLYLFIPARVCSFSCFFFGETLLFSWLFSYFNARIGYREMLPANAAQYFLQVVNAAVAGGALVAFMHRRKGVPWLAGGCTMIFQALLDFQVMAWIALAGALFVPSFPLQTSWYYPALVIIALWVWAGFWMRGRPRSPMLRWFYDRPSFSAFRQARLHHYAVLMAIRMPIFLVQCLSFYLQMISFNIHVTLGQAIASTPAIMLVTALPIVPVGLGTDQAVMVYGFRAYGAKADLLGMSLATNAMGMIFRLALGLSSAGAFARELADEVQTTEAPAVGEVLCDGSWSRTSESASGATEVATEVYSEE